ncbi:MAG: flavodoxin [Methanosphaera sp.]|nr:flavodoxin [Methanosphaera sp.]
MDLVIYYSRTGKTRYVAKEISKKLGCNTIEIKDNKSRSGITGYISGAFDTVVGNQTSIEPQTVDLADYDTIYIGTPVWAYNPTPAILEFIHNTNFNNKNVVTFITLGSQGIDSCLKRLNGEIINKGGRIINSYGIISHGDFEDNTREMISDL